jgi:hypothetical protein
VGGALVGSKLLGQSRAHDPLQECAKSGQAGLSASSQDEKSVAGRSAAPTQNRDSSCDRVPPREAMASHRY